MAWVGLTLLSMFHHLAKCHPVLKALHRQPVLFFLVNSDLNLDIDCSDYCSVKARSSKGFGLMWAGVKATYGATKGKVCFEVSITGNNDVGHLENEPTPHVIRCGWSVSDASMQLGEEELSWGYGGTGKKSVACKFVDYGVRFGVGDILGCYLVSDLSSFYHTFLCSSS